MTRCDGGTEGHFLHRADECYLRVARLLREERLSAESQLCLVQELAEFCQFNHTGRFADGRIENVALGIGARLDALVPEVYRRDVSVRSPLGTEKSRRILHVATSVEAIGGHTRTLRHWVDSDQDSTHSLILTAQGGEVPPPVVGSIRDSGGQVEVLPHPGPLLPRAWRVRAAARSADLVVLHHYGYDVVPIVAFAVEGPPVALVNHADHLFWLGASVADVVIQQRSISKVLGPDRRWTRDDVVLPIPLDPGSDDSSRESARDRLRIPQEACVLVSVGRACKYVPSDDHHFVGTAIRILERLPHAHLYLVGVAADDREVLGGTSGHPRLHLVGCVEDTTLYLRAADTYLEGFPFGSQTALLEAALAGLPLVRAYAPPLDLLVSSGEFLDELTPTPPTEDAYVAEVIALAGDPQRRRHLGQCLRVRALDGHTGAGWRARLEAVYRQCRALPHRACVLPEVESSATARDLALSRWQALRRRESQPPPLSELIRTVLLQSAYRARASGDYGVAARLLWQGLCHFGFDRRSVSALWKLIPYKLGLLGHALPKQTAHTRVDSTDDAASPQDHGRLQRAGAR